MVKTIFLAAIVSLMLLPDVAPAQSVAPETQLQTEARRKRLVVRPEPPVAEGIRDAERAADVQAAENFSREASPVVRRAPQLDSDVVNSIQSRNIPRGVTSRRGQ